MTDEEITVSMSPDLENCVNILQMMRDWRLDDLASSEQYYAAGRLFDLLLDNLPQEEKSQIFLIEAEMLGLTL